MRRLIDISGALVRHLTPTAIPTPERYLDPLLKLFHHLSFLLLSLSFLKIARPLNSPARTRSRGDAPPRSLPFVYWRGAAHHEKVFLSEEKDALDEIGIREERTVEGRGIFFGRGKNWKKRIQ